MTAVLASAPVRPMSTLVDQQRALQSAITSGSDAGALLAPRCPIANPCWRVYQPAYTSRLVGALADNFGVLPRVMATRLSMPWRTVYVAAIPRGRVDSLVPATSCRCHRPRARRWCRHPALTDLARMEWALRRGVRCGPMRMRSMQGRSARSRRSMAATHLSALAQCAIALDAWRRSTRRPSRPLWACDWQSRTTPIRGSEPSELVPRAAVENAHQRLHL